MFGVVGVNKSTMGINVYGLITMHTVDTVGKSKLFYDDHSMGIHTEVSFEKNSLSRGRNYSTG